MPRITLDAAPLRLTIDPELGASITDFSIEGPCGDRYPLMRRAPDQPTEPGQCASFVMAPWTNRIEHAAFDFAGTHHRLRANFPDGTAIHGVARDAPWRITDRTPVSARLVYDSRAHESANFPFVFACVQRFELAPDHLEVELSVTNLDDRPMPAALGHHPFFPRVLFAAKEEALLHAPVAGRYPADRCLPTAHAAPDEHCARLSTNAPVGNHGLDDVFAGFAGRATITWPGSGVRLTMDCSDALDHLVVFTPRLDPADPAAPPLPWFCVEPCSAVNNAFNLAARGWAHTGTRTLEPAQTLAATVFYHIERL
ncbi:MAG: hypothetical protein D6692_14645 [Planctomycetota bacterium]|nr:MAG: hypothetical protein D6692_14645 [Planctomycetota bacterium]